MVEYLLGILSHNYFVDVVLISYDQFYFHADFHDFRHQMFLGVGRLHHRLAKIP